MQENYCALAVAILSPLFLMPENAFRSLSSGQIIKMSRGQRDKSGLTATDTADMAVMRAEGMTYREIADCYGIDASAVFNRIKRGGCHEKA